MGQGRAAPGYGEPESVSSQLMTLIRSVQMVMRCE